METFHISFSVGNRVLAVVFGVCGAHSVRFSFRGLVTGCKNTWQSAANLALQITLIIPATIDGTVSCQRPEE